MKTSNKLLLTGLLALIASSFISMLIAKNNMIITFSSPEESTQGELIVHSISEELVSDTLILREHSNYIIDPNSTEYTVEIPSNYIDYFSFKNEGIADILKVESSIEHDLLVRYGIKGKNNLTIIAKDHSSLSCESALKLNMLNINADDNSKLRINISADSLSFDLADYNEIHLEGDAKVLEIRAEDHVAFMAKNMNANNLYANLEDNARVYINKVDFISGVLENNSKVFTDKAWQELSARTYDEAGVYNSEE